MAKRLSKRVKYIFEKTLYFLEMMCFTVYIVAVGSLLDFYLFTFYYMRNSIDTLARGSEQIINLSDVSTKKAIETAKLCETVKIKIENLTPNRGPVSIPVRIIEPTEPILYIERLIKKVEVTPEEFIFLRELFQVLES